MYRSESFVKPSQQSTYPIEYVLHEYQSDPSFGYTDLGADADKEGLGKRRQRRSEPGQRHFLESPTAEHTDEGTP